MLRAVLIVLVMVWPSVSHAQSSDLAAVIDTHRAAIAKASRKTIDPVLADMIATGSELVPEFLEKWRDKDLWEVKESGAFVYALKEGDGYALTDPLSREPLGTATKKELKQLKPNSGVRSVIATALVQFQLSDPDLARRSAGVQSIERDPEAAHLGPLRASIESEPDADLKARKIRLERLLTVRFDEDEAARVGAIESFKGDLGIDARAALNPLLVTRTVALSGAPDEGLNVPPS